jgi:hypothetical protein
MTWRLAIDRWRADRRRMAREYASASEPCSLSTEDVVVARERSKYVWIAIDKLPEKLRLVVKQFTCPRVRAPFYRTSPAVSGRREQRRAVIPRFIRRLLCGYCML